MKNQQQNLLVVYHDTVWLYGGDDDGCCMGNDGSVGLEEGRGGTSL